MQDPVRKRLDTVIYQELLLLHALLAGALCCLWNVRRLISLSGMLFIVIGVVATDLVVLAAAGGDVLVVVRCC